MGREHWCPDQRSLLNFTKSLKGSCIFVSFMFSLWCIAFLNMILPDFLCPLFFVSVGISITDGFGAFRSGPNHYSGYESEVNPNYSSGKPTARHKWVFFYYFILVRRVSLPQLLSVLSVTIFKRILLMFVGLKMN